MYYYCVLYVLRQTRSPVIIYSRFNCTLVMFLVSIVVSIPACHAGDRGSIPRRGELFCYGHNGTYQCKKFFFSTFYFSVLFSALLE